MNNNSFLSIGQILKRDELKSIRGGEDDMMLEDQGKYPGDGDCHQGSCTVFDGHQTYQGFCAWVVSCAGICECFTAYGCYHPSGGVSHCVTGLS